MAELNQEESTDDTSELKKVLPFMSVFPFDDYEIKLIKREDDFVKLGISPILIDQFGDTWKTESLNFLYLEDGSEVSISLYRGDVEWIAEEAENIKKIDALRKTLDDSLASKDLIAKAKAIKVGKKFSKLLNRELNVGIEFYELLIEFLEIYETSLHSRIKQGLQKLSEATLRSTEFSEKQFKAVTAFLNFQIHYIKILLGIVIAAKLY